jgi:hypothetical protein
MISHSWETSDEEESLSLSRFKIYVTFITGSTEQHSVPIYKVLYFVPKYQDTSKLLNSQYFSFNKSVSCIFSLSLIYFERTYFIPKFLVNLWARTHARTHKHTQQREREASLSLRKQVWNSTSLCAEEHIYTAQLYTPWTTQMSPFLNFCLHYSPSLVPDKLNTAPAVMVDKSPQNSPTGRALA